MSVFAAINPNLSETDKVTARQKLLLSKRSIDSHSPLFSPLLFDPGGVGKKNCENLVGQIAVPLGIAGPISATIKTASGTQTITDLLLPLATTEGALIASVNRGCKLLNLASQTTVVINNVGMSRAPVFACSNHQSALALSLWLQSHAKELSGIAEKTSHHLRFLSCRLFVKDSLVFARYSFDTGEAMGMNMVTIGTAAIVRYVLSRHESVTCPALSSNVCTDKKTSAVNRRYGRGRYLTVTAKLSEENIQTILKTTPAKLLATYHAKIVVGSRLAGLAGHNMQVANVAAAILAATGQDLAHTVDISQGTLTFKPTKSGLQAKLVLPTVPVGTLGGGTNLPAQMAARSVISNLPVTSDILAATIGLAALAAELSGLAALSTGTLASSHQKLGRYEKK